MFHVRPAPLVVMVVIFAVAGCDRLILCAPEPEDSHGVCDPNQPVCGGGSPDPQPDPRQDGAVDIRSFPPDQIPAGVILSVPNEGAPHVLKSDPLTYAVNPPASGPHYDTPAEPGFYCTALSPGHWVHSLEHGYIVILFDEAGTCTAGHLRAGLNALLYTAPLSPTFGNRKLVITPYGGLPHPICVVGWNRQLYLDTLDYPATLDFYQTYIDMGPESSE